MVDVADGGEGCPAIRAATLRQAIRSLALRGNEKRMIDWCHSGLEAYCKASAQLMGDAPAGASWLPFCRDLLPDRTLGNLTKAWTLSNERQGRSCRQMLFEKAWLNGRHGKDYADEAESKLRSAADRAGDRPSDAIEAGITAEECRRMAIRRCEHDAIEACVAHMTSINEEGEFENDPQMALLVAMPDFAISFFTTALPSIEAGFLAERYRASDIRQFSLTLGDLLYDAQYQGDEATDGLRAFAMALVAGLIYGPSHPVALDRPWDATVEYLPYDQPVTVPGDMLRVTQIFDRDLRVVGYSEVFDKDQVVFFGRCPDAKRYLDRAREMFVDEPELFDQVASCDAVVFPISADHAQTGNLHGMLLFSGDSWHFYDFHSTNGSSVLSEEESDDVGGVIRVHPGDRIRLGAPVRSDDTMAYWGASTVLVSQYADEGPG